MHIKHYFVIQFIILILVGCNNHRPTGSDNNPQQEEYTIHYAKGFQVKKHGDYTEVSVINPWDSTQLLQKYILVDKTKELPANLPKGTVVRVPLDKVVAYNTIHCSTFDELQTVNIVKGVCEPEYIKVQKVLDGIKTGKIEVLGSASDPDIEKVIMLSPEAIFASPISGQTYGNITKTKVPIIETPDYTEPHPLGRAEWIRFYSLFVGKEQFADSLYDITIKKYNEIKELVANKENSPTVLTDTRYMGAWNMPGGKSYMANMLSDAGAKYPWSDDKSATFLPLSFEAVLDKAGNANVWLIRYYADTDMTYKSLAKEYKPYSYFEAFKKKNIWGCNTMYSPYYEDLPIHPEYILKDFATIFHPDLFPGYTPKYYKKIGE